MFAISDNVISLPDKAKCEAIILMVSILFLFRSTVYKIGKANLFFYFSRHRCNWFQQRPFGHTVDRLFITLTGKN